MGNAVLFAAGACWEGVDFPGDMVSSLILARLPFPVPDPLSEAEKEQYPSLQEYIQAVVVPEMQKKLRQGFGRAIRTETDTCVISILDCRAVPEGRYHHAALDALPPMPTTRRIEDVATFIREKKSPEYFEEGSVFNADDLPAGQAVSHADCGDQYFMAFSALKKMVEKEKVTMEDARKMNLLLAERFGVRRYEV